MRHKRLTDTDSGGATGITHLYYRQLLNGLDIRNADLGININEKGEVINAHSSFVKLNQVTKAIADELKLSAIEATESLAREFKWEQPVVRITAQKNDPSRQVTMIAGAISPEEIKAHLHYLPTATGIELAWNIVIQTHDYQHWYDTSISASTGKILFITDWVVSDSHHVFAEPSTDPDDGNRVLLSNVHNSSYSPFGWNDTNGVTGPENTDTRGNNVDAKKGSYHADAGSTLEFDFPLDLQGSVSDNVDPGLSNVFYWCNRLHDIHSIYGFDEQAGNFQVTNYSGASGGFDPVNATIQISEWANATMGTPADGSSPQMNMYHYQGRDGSYSNDVIIHEFGHGVSNRLTGGKSNSSALSSMQSGGMGEGWGDWWGMMFTQESSDTSSDNRKIGAWYFGLANGIRSYPYTYDMNVNPLTYANYPSRTQVHAAGEIWCSTLWDMNWELINVKGFSSDYSYGNAGNNIALALVMEGLKLQGANPSFLDARDGILLADQQLYNGQHLLPIWTAFARRGMGENAYDGGSANSSNITADFTIPLSVQGPAIGVQNLVIDDSLGNKRWYFQSWRNTNSKLQFKELRWFSS